MIQHSRGSSSLNREGAPETGNVPMFPWKKGFLAGNFPCWSQAGVHGHSPSLRENIHGFPGPLFHWKMRGKWKFEPFPSLLPELPEPFCQRRRRGASSTSREEDLGRFQRRWDNSHRKTDPKEPMETPRAKLGLGMELSLGISCGNTWLGFRGITECSGSEGTFGTISFHGQGHLGIPHGCFMDSLVV